MMGDINLPNIDWESWNNKSDNIETQDYQCIQCIQDNCLHQHVNKPNRWRGTDTPQLDILVFSGVRVTRSLVLYVHLYVLEIVVCPFVLFLLAIVLSVLLRYTDSDCPFGIFKLFL
jgi:hypothetical protein